MVKTERIIEIDAPPNVVFELLADFEQYPRWMSRIESVTVTEDRALWTTDDTSVDDVQWETEVTERDPPRALTWRAAGGDFAAEAAATFVETERNTTLLKISLGYGPNGDHTGHTETSTDEELNSLLINDLESFKHFVEAQGAAEPATTARTTGELDPAFVEQFSLGEKSNGVAAANDFSADAESDFGKTLEQMGRQAVQASPTFYESSPAITAGDVSPDDRATSTTVATTVAPPAAQPAPAVATATKAARFGDVRSPTSTRPAPSSFARSLPAARFDTEEQIPAEQSPETDVARARVIPKEGQVFASTVTRLAPPRRARFSPFVYLFFVAAALVGGALGFWFAPRQSSSPAADAAESSPQTNASAPSTLGPPAAGGTEQVRQSSSQTVPSGEPAATTAAAAAVVVAAPTGAPAPAADAVLRDSLTDWIKTTNARDISRLTSFYMPTLDTFYQKRRAGRASVRDEKNRVIGRAESVQMSAGKPTIDFSRDGQRATMRFRKIYAVRDSRRTQRGEVVQELIWQKTDNGWKIVSERDAQVIR